MTGGRDTVALRVPAHHLCGELLRICGDGIVAPSANRFGAVSPTTAAHVIEELGSDVDLVLDGGPCAIGVESTIVECIGVPQVLRPGGVSAEQVESVVGGIWLDSTGEARAPGMLSSHYAPRAEVLLVESLEAAESIARDRGDGTAVLWHADPVEYARLVYADLRRLDAREVRLVVAVMPSESGIGRAVRDRLTKAAAPR